MDPYRSDGDHFDDGDAGEPGFGQADDLVVVAVLFVIGGVVAAAGFFGHPAVTTPGAIGLLMMAFAVWSVLRELARRRRIARTPRAKLRA